MINNLIDSWPILLSGTVVTIKLWFYCSAISIIFGTLWGTLQADRLRIYILSNVLDFITLILRGVPLYAQLIIIYFVLPEIIGLNFSAFTSGVIGLGLCSAAYTSQIIKAGLNAVPKGQWDASFVLGYTKLEQLRYIILPQTLKIVFPALTNEYVMVLKSTSILASIGVVELTKISMNMITRSADPVTTCISMAVIYLLMSFVISFTGKFIERKLYVKN